jgi:phosphatidylglycerol:prolipoprotein diacylglycerol transferase
VIGIEAAGAETLVRWPVFRPLPRSEPVHPTQIYSAINGLVLCLFLLAYAPFRQRDGEIWAMFLTLYPITRFLLEIIRIDEPGVFGTGLSISQVVSLILLICAVAFWAQVWMKPPGTAFPKYQPSPAPN